MESEVHALRKENKSLKASVQECRRYSCRWFLKLHGVAEKDNEDVRSVVLNILGKIAPGVGDGLQDSVDVVHRLGPKRTDGKTRSIIILFSQRRIRDIIWSAAKDKQFNNSIINLTKELFTGSTRDYKKNWEFFKYKARYIAVKRSKELKNIKHKTDSELVNRLNVLLAKDKITEEEDMEIKKFNLEFDRAYLEMAKGAY
ncbi:hypothetical protein PO909_006272 [Leuciscus waleckii]